MEANSIFSPGGNGLTGTTGTGAAWDVGNCAIAMQATTGNGGNGLRVAEIENVEIAATGTDQMAAQYPGAHSTHTCGIYLAQWPQWSEFRNIDIRGMNTGVAIPALPTTPAGLNADSNRWQNVTIQATHAFTAAAGSNNVLDNVVALAGNSSATGEPPTGLVLDLNGSGQNPQQNPQQGWTVRNAVVVPAWNAVQPALTVTTAGGAVTAVTVGSEQGLGWDPYGTSVPVVFSGLCSAQATATVNANGAISGVNVTQGGVGCSATTTASLNAAGTWDTAAPVNLIGGQDMTFFAGNLLKGNGGYTVWNAANSASYGTQLDGGGGTLPGGGTYVALVGGSRVGAAFQVDQFPGADIGAKIQACVNAVNASYGGTCDARNFTGSLTMGSSLTISTGNVAILLPCATITTANQIVVTAGTRNVSLRGCALRGGTQASGSTGGTALAYTGSNAMVEVGDPTYATDTPGFHVDNMVINTTGATNATAQGLVAYRTQEMDLESLYFLGNSNQTGMTLDGTGNYTGGTFLDNEFSGFWTAVNAIGHQVTNPATTDWANASTFVRLHIDCPTSGGNPISGTYGINLQQGDGNTFTGGDVEGCSTALHLGPNAQNNTIVGLRNENSTSQVVAEAGSAYNNWMTGGTMFIGKLTDNGTRNSFLDTFHRSFNALNGDWYMSQQDATLTNHFRLGTGTGNERGLLNEIQTDYGYRWLYGFSDATGGQQLYQMQDLLNNVYRLQIQQWNSGQSSTNNQTALNAAGTGNVCFNCSTNSGTGGVTFASGGATPLAVATVDKAGDAQFVGNLLVGGTTQSAGTLSLRNSADAEVDYYLWPGLTTSQKGSFTYKDWNGASQWYMVKDASNNWALNSATGGLDSFKAYQSINSGDTYIDASNSTGHIRLNYETGSGTETDIYSGSSTNLDAAFVAPNAIKFPGLAASSGDFCLQIDNSGYITNTGSPCGSGSGSGGVSGTINSGSAGQIAFYTANGATIGGMNAVPLSSGGTGATSASGALANLGGLSAAATTPQTLASALTGPSLNASVNTTINVMAPPYNAKGDCSTDDHNAIQAAMTTAASYSPPAVVYFPKSPGACYLTSTLTWNGASFQGQAPLGVNPPTGTAGVILRGMPGEDVLHVPDPSTVSTASPTASWSIRDLVIQTDDSVDASSSFPHRWPGRWFNDAAMSASSAVLTTTSGEISCGDVGQNIQVNGAGVGGANLITTISSVVPCAGNIPQTVTLAAAASTNVSATAAYITPASIPLTTTVGNCGIAFDNRDGNPADWTMTNVQVPNQDVLRDLVFTSTSSTLANHSCGIFTQGTWGMYALDAQNVDFSGLDFGVVQACSETNSHYQSCANDFQTWDHGDWSMETYPWISYNGGDITVKAIELTTTNGPQVLQLGNQWHDQAARWEISAPEFEGNTGVVGWRIEGGPMVLGNTVLGGSAPAYLDANDSICNSCSGYGLLTLNGYQDTVELSGDINHATMQISDAGFGNLITGAYDSNPAGSQEATRFSAQNMTRGPQPAGIETADFIRGGNVATPYFNDLDLFIWPEDIGINGTGQRLTADSTSLTGKYYAWPQDGTMEFVSSLDLNNGRASNSGNALVISNTPAGGNVPAMKVIVYLNAKCASPTTMYMTVQAGATSVTSTSASCLTTYSTMSVVADLSGYSGQDLGIKASVGSAANLLVSWLAVRPFQADYNGQQPVLSSTPIGTTGGGAAVPTGPATSASGDVVTYTGTSGQEQDSGVPLSSLSARAGTGSCPTGQYETGDATGGPTCTQVAYTQISGTPSGLAPSGAAGGDLAGSYPNPTVTQINGGAVPVSATVLGTNASGQPVATTAAEIVSAIGTTAVASAATAATATTATTATNFTGSLAGDAAGTQGATTVSKINGGAVPTSAGVLGTNASGQPVTATTTGSGSVVLATSPSLSAPTVSGTLAGASETLSGTLSVGGATTMQNNATLQNGTNSSQTLAIQPGSSADQIGALQFNNYSGTAEWQVRKDANNYLRVTDQVNSLDRMILPANANTTINAGAGANAVVINNTSGSGTGGFIVYEGGSNSSTAAFQVSGSGNTTATGYLQGKFMMGTGTMGVAAGAAAGSSPTIACATSHTCDGVSGTVTLTTGTSPTAGTLATLSFPNTHTNQANCMVSTLSATGMITSNTWTESTTAITIAANTALTASTAYTIKYWCGGY